MIPESPVQHLSPGVAAPTKRHYLILDGLRGVASVMVVLFHLFEAYALGDPFKQIINHGYLAVDFFFLLSGFVIAYAYDDRWGKMSTWDFFRRRLVRLQPMVVMGNSIGAVLFYFQISPMFPLIATTPIWKMLLVMLVSYTLLPLPTSLDIRGWQEMHPLDGPAWSLFFEYIANILYALGIRKLSNRALGVVVVLAAAFTLHLAILGASGDLIGGWSLNFQQLHIGFARVCFPFFAGIVLMRVHGCVQIKNSFAVCSLLLIVALCLPRFGDHQHLWINGLYEAFCVLLIFPLIVAIGAGEQVTEGLSIRIARFFGDLSYPLYITHYPLIYMYTAWVRDKKVPGDRGAMVGGLVLVASIGIAYASLKLYDEPVRSWLSRRFLKRPA